MGTLDRSESVTRRRHKSLSIRDLRLGLSRMGLELDPQELERLLLEGRIGKNGQELNQEDLSNLLELSNPIASPIAPRGAPQTSPYAAHVAHTQPHVATTPLRSPSSSSSSAAYPDAASGIYRGVPAPAPVQAPPRPLVPPDAEIAITSFSASPSGLADLIGTTLRDHGITAEQAFRTMNVSGNHAGLNSVGEALGPAS